MTHILMHIFTHTHTHTHTQTRGHGQGCISEHNYAYPHTLSQTRTHAHTKTHTPTHKCAKTHTHTHGLTYEHSTEMDKQSELIIKRPNRINVHTQSCIVGHELFVYHRALYHRNIPGIIARILSCRPCPPCHSV